MIRSFVDWVGYGDLYDLWLARRTRRALARVVNRAVAP